MAVSSSSYFKNGTVIGVPQVAVDFDKFAEHATPRFPIGFKVEDGDGSIYRYSHFGATVNRGVVVAQDLSESSLGDSDNSIVASASASVTTDGLAGQKYVEINTGIYGTSTSTSIAANQYAGGKLIITDDAGEGYTYNIVGNTSNASANMRLQLKEEIQVALTATTDFIIVGNKYANLEIATTTDEFFAGVTCRTISTAGYYGWIQTKGIVGILTGTVDVAGENLLLSTLTPGAVVTASDTGQATPTINAWFGFSIIPGDSTGHGAYWVNFE